MGAGAPSLTEFLRARIAEDRRMAEGWRGENAAIEFHEHGDVYVMDPQPWVRVLAECDSKAWLVEGMQPFGPIDDINATEVLGRIASVYADHPDYQQEWQPLSAEAATTSVEELRKAAEALRERAEDATPAPWRDSQRVAGVRFAALVADAPHPDRPTPERGGWAWDDAYGGCLIGESMMSKDRAYVATMHPGVGLALSDWLSATARDCGTSSHTFHAGLTLARLINGGAAMSRLGEREPLPIHRTEAGYPNCGTCDGGGCLDCTDPA